jgi:formylglycine-generating enzyme required for sulfatase activity
MSPQKMADLNSTERSRFTRCTFCGRVYDEAVSHVCPQCLNSTDVKEIDQAPKGPEKSEPVVRDTYRLLVWSALLLAVVALPLALLAVWHSGSGSDPRSKPPERSTLVVRPSQPRPDALIEERPLDLKVGEAFTECEDCPEMVVVPAGSFVMGSSKSEYGETGNEKPQHPVTVAGNLAVGKFEVTAHQFVTFLNDSLQYKRFSDTWVTTTSEDTNASVVRIVDGSGVRFSAQPGQEEYPITFVSWSGAVEYANWLSRRAKTRYRLLSEAEWEYAARAGSQSTFYFGDDALKLCEHGNVADLTAQKENHWSPVVNCDDGFAKLAPIGKFRPNPFGLHDMIGNAAEWVEDCWHATYQGGPANGSAWISQSDCNSRVVRGGAYNNLPVGLRSATRYVNPADTRIELIGFRVTRPIRSTGNEPPLPAGLRRIRWEN